jgi:hypothetical protein
MVSSRKMTSGKIPFASLVGDTVAVDIDFEDQDCLAINVCVIENIHPLKTEVPELKLIRPFLKIPLFRSLLLILNRDV